jgi:hypothetical protein
MGRIDARLPTAGILFGVLLAVALVVTQSEPTDNATVQQVFSYWSSHGGGRMWLSVFMLEFAAVLLVCFGAALRVAIRSGERGDAIYSPLVLAGAVLAATGFATTAILPAAAGRLAADKGGEAGVRTAVYAIEQLRAWDWLLWTPGLAVMLVAAGLGGLRTTALPKLLCRSAIALGVALFTPLGFGAFILLPVWMVAAGVVLQRRESARLVL